MTRLYLFNEMIANFFQSIPRTIWIITGLTFAVALVFGFDLTPWVRGGYGWRWQWIPAPLERVLPLLLASLIYLIGVLMLLRRKRPATRLILLWSIIGTIALSLAITHAREGDAFFTLFARTVYGGTTGQHWSATQIDWSDDTWLEWTTVMQDLGGHLGTAPPGLSMFYAGVNDLLDGTPITDPLHREFLLYQCHNYDLLSYTPAQWASALFGMMMPLWAGLTVIPLYAVSKRLFDDRRYAVYTALSWTLVLGMLAFTASWSTFFPFFAILAFWLLVIGLETTKIRHIWWIFLAGLATGIAHFINFAFLPLLGLFGLYTLGHYWIQVRNTTQPLRIWDILRPSILVGIYFGLGLILPWVVFWLAGGSTVIDILQTSFDYHLDLDRPLWFWAGMHLWDWSVFTSLALAIVWLVAIGHWWRNRRDTQLPLLSITLLVTILIMTLSGTTRGESGRIWLFMSPFMIIAGIDGLRRISSQANDTGKAFGVIMVANIAMMIVVSANLLLMTTPLVSPPLAPQVTVDRQVYARFEVNDSPAFDLTGWSSEIVNTDDRQAIRLSLQWQGVAQVTEAHLFGAFLINPAGEVVNFTNWQPNERADYRYPTTCWTPNTTIGDSIDLPLPDGAESGDWWVSLAAFGEQSDHPEGRLSVTYAGNPDDVQIGLGPITVE